MLSVWEVVTIHQCDSVSLGNAQAARASVLRGSLEDSRSLFSVQEYIDLCSVPVSRIQTGPMHAVRAGLPVS